MGVGWWLGCEISDFNNDLLYRIFFYKVGSFVDFIYLHYGFKSWHNLVGSRAKHE
jgi:hypothetical protein